MKNKRKSKFILLFFLIVFFGVAVCEFVKGVQVAFALGLVILILSTFGNSCKFNICYYLMMLLPLLFESFTPDYISSISKYEIYFLLCIFIAKIRIVSKYLVYIAAATCCIHVFATLFFFICRFAYFIYFYGYAVNIFEKFPIGTEGGEMGYTAGLTSHYSANALYVVMGMLALTAITLSKGMKKKAYIYVLMCASILALLLTTKRAHLLFGIIVVVFCYVWENKNKKGIVLKYLFTGILCISISYIMISVISPDILAVFDRFDANPEEMSNGRFNLWKTALTFWTDSPLIGIGWLQFFERYSAYDSVSYNVHNVYLQILCEKGIIGFICFLTMVVSQYKNILYLINNIKYFSDDESMALRYSFYVSTFFILYCFTGNCLYDNTLFYYMIASGVSWSLRYKIEKKKNKNRYEKNSYSNIL